LKAFIIVSLNATGKQQLTINIIIDKFGVSKIFSNVFERLDL